MFTDSEPPWECVLTKHTMDFDRALAAGGARFFVRLDLMQGALLVAAPSRQLGPVFRPKNAKF